MKKQLSFCISCKNRMWQIKETLLQNLKDNVRFKSIVEFVLVDFGSKDGLREWVLSNCLKEINEGYLNYYYTDRLPNWHACATKNTAHLFSRGKIVTNLDCDNFTGKNGGRHVLDCFTRYKMPIVVHQFSGDFEDGSFGRISVERKYFLELGGYDEEFAPMAYQDSDLILRFAMMGLEYVALPDKDFNRAIYNTKEEGIINSGSKMSYNEMNLHNKNLSMSKLESDNIVRNNGAFGIREGILNHLGDEVSYSTHIKKATSTVRPSKVKLRR
jgi:glycosyltransferase involved in cell wall biosynthesis